MGSIGALEEAELGGLVKEGGSLEKGEPFLPSLGDLARNL